MDEVTLLRSSNEALTSEAADLAQALVDVIVVADEADVIKRTLAAALASPLALDNLRARRGELEP